MVGRGGGGEKLGVLFSSFGVPIVAVGSETFAEPVATGVSSGTRTVPFTGNSTGTGRDAVYQYTPPRTAIMITMILMSDD